MSRRIAPDDRYDTSSAGPLFEAADTARERGHSAARAASARAASLDATWKQGALAAVRTYAETHDQPFLFESIEFVVPLDADRRAIGHIAKEAQRLGWIKPHGYAPAASSNGSPKSAWLSLIFKGARP